MGKTSAGPYVVRYQDQAGWHEQPWEHRTRRPYCGYGIPDNDKAELWRKEMNNSVKMGASNVAVSLACGFVPHVSRVHVIRVADSQVVATAIASASEVA
jgi:hypothetical protein